MGYRSGMDNDKAEAVQAVVDRLTSYQESAPEGTVEHELREALGETDVDLSDDQITRLSAAIDETQEGDGPVDVTQVLD